jgi:ribosome maturation factor RimP
MQNAERIEAIRAIVTPILASLGLDLVEVNYSGGRSGVLRIFIDRKGGVGLDDCERAHRLLGHALDAADPVPSSYALEVSSPGLDRPLKSERDFLRHLGERIRVRTSLPVEGRSEWVGEIAGVDGERLTLKLPDARELKVPRAQVAQAKRVVDV